MELQTVPSRNRVGELDCSSEERLNVKEEKTTCSRELWISHACGGYDDVDNITESVRSAAYYWTRGQSL